MRPNTYPQFTECWNCGHWFGMHEGARCPPDNNGRYGRFIPRIIYKMPRADIDTICANCGNMYGSHRDNYCPNREVTSRFRPRSKPMNPTSKTIRDGEIQLEAVKGGNLGYVKVTFPCGEYRHIQYADLQQLIARLSQAHNWLGTNDSKKEF